MRFAKLKDNDYDYIYSQLDKHSLEDMAKKYDLPYRILSDRMYKRGYKCKKLRDLRDTASVNHNYFNDIDNEDKAYWLGFLFADGCMIEPIFGNKGRKGQIVLELAIKDLDHLNKFKQHISSESPISFRTNNNGCNCCRIRITSEKLYNDLVALGCCPRKSLILTFPKNIRKDLIKHFIRGYFDGDGTTYVSNKRLRIKFFGTLDMMENIYKELNIIQHKIQQEKKMYYFSIQKISELQQVFNYLYDDATIFLNRKHNIISNYFIQRNHINGMAS